MLYVVCCVLCNVVYCMLSVVYCVNVVCCMLCVVYCVNVVCYMLCVVYCVNVVCCICMLCVVFSVPIGFEHTPEGRSTRSNIL